MIAFPAVMMAQLALASLALAFLIGVYWGAKERRSDPDSGTWPGILYGLCVVIAAVAWPITGRWWYLAAVIVALPLAWGLTRTARPLWLPAARAVSGACRGTGRLIVRLSRVVSSGSRKAILGVGQELRRGERASGRAGTAVGRLTAGRTRAAWHGVGRAAILGWPILRGIAVLIGTALRCAAAWAIRRLGSALRNSVRRLSTWSQRDSAAWQRRYEWLHS
jgi:hypothetical protein